MVGSFSIGTGFNAHPKARLFSSPPFPMGGIGAGSNTPKKT